MKTVSIIRNRGQLTIPNTIRKLVNWVMPESVVTISLIKSDEIMIRPHQKQVDWDKVWEGIRKSRAIKGKGKGSLSKFIVEDRERH